MNARTYVMMVLDRSGSMDRIKKQAVDGFNEQVQALKDDNFRLGETWVSFFTFNSRWEEKYFNQSINHLVEMEDKEYTPRGNTSLRDTLWHVLDRLESSTDVDNDNNAYLVVVISDGRDTSSKSITESRLAERIKKLQDTKRWTFTWLGAGQDLFRLQRALNLSAGNVAEFAPTPEGVRYAMHQNSNAIKEYGKKRAKGFTQVQDFYGSDKISKLIPKKEEKK